MTAASPMRASRAMKRKMYMDVVALLHGGSPDATRCRQPGWLLCEDCEERVEPFRLSGDCAERGSGEPHLHVGRAAGIEVDAGRRAHPAHHDLVADAAAQDGP